MIAFLRTRIGLTCLILFLALMGFMTHRIMRKPAQPEARAPKPEAIAQEEKYKPESRPPKAATPDRKEASAGATAPASKTKEGKTKGSASKAAADERTDVSIQQTLSQIDQVARLSKQSRTERDRTGQPVTRRRTPAQAPDIDPVADPATKPVVSPGGTSGGGMGLRLAGRVSPKNTDSAPHSLQQGEEGKAAPIAAQQKQAPAISESSGSSERTVRFSPYGRPIKCELVFTLDSTLEETPIVALVVEPVYNNGVLVLPAGAELHGRARPDRLRDRLFSAKEWMLILPREGTRPNGRQLAVVGYALDRSEPEGSGDTWGITDGSFGLQGEVIRTMNEAEIHRFASTFLATGALALQERQGGARSNRSVLNTPANAALAGTAATLNQIAQQIGEEIARNGVFIRVPAGKQFYFYPQQAISPDRAGLPTEAIPP